MDTTQAVISWTEPVYIPKSGAVTVYVLGYYMLLAGNCPNANRDVIFYLNCQFVNKSTTSTSETVVDLMPNTYYLFAVRPQSKNGYGAWRTTTGMTVTASDFYIHNLL